MVKGRGKKGKLPPKSHRVTRSQRRAMDRSLSNTGHEDLNTQLKNLGLCTKNITGDGNCLFRALSDQYYGTDTHHRTIRQEICDYLKQHEENYKFFVEDDQSFEHHVECMEQIATFGGNMELAAFAKMRAVDIKVYQPGMIYIINGSDDSSTEKEDGDAEEQEKDHIQGDAIEEEEEEEHEKSKSQVLHIAYHSWEHYSSVRNIDGPYSGPPEIKVTNGHASNIAEEDEEVDEVVETLDSKEKMVLTAYPGASVKKVRRLLKRFNGDPNKVIDKLYEEVQVVIENLDQRPAIHPLEAGSGVTKRIAAAELPDAQINSIATEEKTTAQEDISQLSRTSNETEERISDKEMNDSPNKKEQEATVATAASVEAIEEEEDDQEKKLEEKPPAEKKPKKQSNRDRKFEQKMKQKEQKRVKDQAKAAARVKQRKEEATTLATDASTTDKPLATTHSMKEMYI